MDVLGKIKFRLGMLPLKAAATDDDRCAATNGSIIGKPFIVTTSIADKSSSRSSSYDLVMVEGVTTGRVD